MLKAKVLGSKCFYTLEPFHPNPRVPGGRGVDGGLDIFKT